MFAFLFYGVSGTTWANSASFPWGGENEFLDAEEVFQLGGIRHLDGRVEATGTIADDYYVYRHSLKLVDGRGDLVELHLPTGEARHDEFFGDTEVYTDALHLYFPAEAAAPLTLHWQGCAEAGICYPPQTLQVSVSQ